MKGIDVSKWQGDIDWSKVKVDFAILRAGWGTNGVDPKFVANYKGCKKYKIPVGVYWYSYAETVAEAKKEAQKCLSVLKGKQFEFPILFDIEEKSQLALGKEKCTALVTAFCETLEKAGYFAGIYSFQSFFEANLDKNISDRFVCAVARVPSKDDGKTILEPSVPWMIHQYSWKGKINGINGDVDLDICKVDYPEIIRGNGLNGFSDKYKISFSKSNLSNSEAEALIKKLKTVGIKATKTKI